MCGINIQKIRFSMLKETKIVINEFDALVLALDENELRGILVKHGFFRKVYDYFLNANKSIILLPNISCQRKQISEAILRRVLVRYIKNVLKAECFNILFIYDFNENDC